MSMRRRTWMSILAFAAGSLAGCAEDPGSPPSQATSEPVAAQQTADEPPVETAPAAPRSAQDVFWDELVDLCGLAFAGYLTIGTEESDRSFGESDMTMHVRDCGENEVRIPFAVGDDRSRTWVIRRTDSGLSLHHRHVDENGQPAAPDNYGGDTATEGSARRQEFVVDEATKRNLPETKYNVWAIEVVPANTFAYELQRPEEERYFRIEFDLDEPIASPPTAWDRAD